MKTSKPKPVVTSHKLALLEAAAVAAKGRQEPACQVAMADLYKAAQLLPADLEIPIGDRDWARAHGRSLIEPWVDACPHFEAIEVIEPGALLGFRLGHTLHHVSIALAGGRMVHVFGQHGVQVAPCIPSEWAKRLTRIWRIRK
jgi:cell wall-associated NlpC family hydrolase